MSGLASNEVRVTGHNPGGRVRRKAYPVGGRDPETLAEVAWSALHGIATLTRSRRLRPDYHQARLTMLAGQLADMPG